jgi:anaphase-promoting complex subunit 8
MDEGDDELREAAGRYAELLEAIDELRARGLGQSAKWAAEQLAGLPRAAAPAGAALAGARRARRARRRADALALAAAAAPAFAAAAPHLAPGAHHPYAGDAVVDVESSLVLARAYFDCKEYLRAAHALQGVAAATAAAAAAAAARGGGGGGGCSATAAAGATAMDPPPDGRAVFLRCYALYLAGEQRKNDAHVAAGTAAQHAGGGGGGGSGGGGGAVPLPPLWPGADGLGASPSAAAANPCLDEISTELAAARAVRRRWSRFQASRAGAAAARRHEQQQQQQHGAHDDDHDHELPYSDDGADDVIDDADREGMQGDASAATAAAANAARPPQDEDEALAASAERAVARIRRRRAAAAERRQKEQQQHDEYDEEQDEQEQAEEEEEDPFCLYLSALAAADRGRPLAARRLLACSVALFPCHWAAWTALQPLCPDVAAVASLRLPAHWARDFFLVSACLDLQHCPEALSRLALLNAAFPSSRWVAAAAASAHYGMRNFDEAQALFEDLLERDPHRVEGVDAYSNVLYVKDAGAELSALARRLAASADARRSPEAACAVGNYYSLRGLHERAVASFRRALRLSAGGCLGAWTLMGHEYVEMRNAPAAVACYRRAVELSPRDYRAWYGLGQTYELLGAPRHAAAYYRRAAALRPGDARMWCALGGCFEGAAAAAAGSGGAGSGSGSTRGRDDVRAALRCYRRALEHHDREGVALHKLARLHAQLGERDAAAHYHALNLARLDAEAGLLPTPAASAAADAAGGAGGGSGTNPPPASESADGDPHRAHHHLGAAAAGQDGVEALLFLAEHARDQGRWPDARLWAQRLMDFGGPAHSRAKALLREARGMEMAAAQAAQAAQAGGGRGLRGGEQQQGGGGLVAAPPPRAAQGRRRQALGERRVSGGGGGGGVAAVLRGEVGGGGAADDVVLMGEDPPGGA